MIETWLLYLLGWFRTSLRVSVIETDDILDVEHDLGDRGGRRWSGTLKLRSQRKYIDVQFGRWWLPSRRYEQYDVSGVICNNLGTETVLPLMTFPRMGWRWTAASRLGHSLAIEAFIDYLIKISY